MSGRASRHVHAHAVDQGSRALPLLFSNRRLCLSCGRRRPRFRHRGIVKADADHTLCFQCYRAQMQRTRAALMAAAYARARHGIAPVAAGARRDTVPVARWPSRTMTTTAI